MRLNNDRDLVKQLTGQPDGVRHDPQRFIGKSVAVLPFLKNITEYRDSENFQDLMVASDACYWLPRAISIYRDSEEIEVAN